MRSRASAVTDGDGGDDWATPWTDAMQQAASDSQRAVLRADTMTPINVVTIQQDVSAMRPDILFALRQMRLTRGSRREMLSV